MTSILRSLAAALVVLAAMAGPAAAQADPVATVPDSNAIRILVLGSFHFTGAPDHFGIMSPERQAEMERVVDALARFRPTKVIVEEQVRDSVRMDSLYDAYRAGRHELTRNERQQIGFRLADLMGHDRVWAVDYQHPWPQDKVNSFAERYDSAYVAYQRRWRREHAAIRDSLYRHAGLADNLRYLNSAEFLSRLQAMRLRTMEVDAGGTYVGLEPETAIWHRNMRIFADIVGLSEPGDRVLVVYGAGHAYFFRKWALQHPATTLVEPGSYLP